MNRYLKAIIGAAVAGLGALATSLDGGGVTAAEWIAVATMALLTFGSVYAVPNAPTLKPPVSDT